MLQLFLSVERQTTRLALLGAVLMLIVSVTLGFYQVMTRFVFDAPSTWSEVISRSAMIWCVFLGAAAGFRGGFMMSVEVIYKLVPGRRLIWLELFIAACCAVVLIVLITYGTAMMLRVKTQMLSGLEVSIAWAYAAMPVGASFALIAVVARLLAQATGQETIGPDVEEAPPESPAVASNDMAERAGDTPPGAAALSTLDDRSEHP
ncbi:TRAP transporter small permease [Halomonas kalidii]|uniref:TRAP transporter small permease protein n=1 Tax=Halomonas kalidii TaxID=3043293 RepID=A0ABT6VK88_9GAMM|nr:TRAP transporter small permease [Halomonas kalidii]MDI5934394.1 TRAP transporter small permease [Halomonas kalidii]